MTENRYRVMVDRMPVIELPVDKGMRWSRAVPQDAYWSRKKNPESCIWHPEGFNLQHRAMIDPHKISNANRRWHGDDGTNRKY